MAEKRKQSIPGRPSPPMWPGYEIEIEIEYYSIAQFERITKFDALKH